MIVLFYCCFLQYELESTASLEVLHFLKKQKKTNMRHRRKIKKNDRNKLNRVITELKRKMGKQVQNGAHLLDKLVF